MCGVKSYQFQTRISSILSIKTCRCAEKIKQAPPPPVVGSFWRDLRILLVVVPLFYICIEGAEPRHILDRRDDLLHKMEDGKMEMRMVHWWLLCS